MKFTIRKFRDGRYEGMWYVGYGNMGLALFWTWEGAIEYVRRARNRYDEWKAR